MSYRIISEDNINEMVRLYTVDTMAYTLIATKLGINHATVLKYLKREGIDIRGRVQARNLRKRVNLNNRAQDIVHLYTEGFTIPKLAQMIHTSPHNVSKFIREAGVTIRTQGAPLNVAKYRRAWQLKDAGLTQVEIGKILDVSKQRVDQMINSWKRINGNKVYKDTHLNQLIVCVRCRDIIGLKTGTTKGRGVCLKCADIDKKIDTDTYTLNEESK